MIGTLIPTWGPGHLIWGGSAYLCDEDGFIFTTGRGDSALETESRDTLSSDSSAELTID